MSRLVERVRARLRDRKPPPEVLAVLEPDERAVSWAAVAGGGCAVATPLGLWLPGPEGARRLGWHEIHKATWDEGRLTVTGARPVPAAALPDAEVVVDAPPVVLHLAEPRDLPAEVRTRVTRSVGWTTHHRAPGGGVRVVGRRVPGRDGLSWAVRPDPGTDPADPTVRRIADEAVATARATVGQQTPR